MYSPMPVYAYNRESRPRAPKDDISSTPEFGHPSIASPPNASVPHIHHGITDFFEPAIDGPPSPERIRAFSNQMKRNSNADKHRSELTTSSGSSSRLSANSDRPSWNQSVESLGLSRNPSQRSTSSGVPSRERPDSVQFFGKAIFNRSKGKLRREGSDHNSSNSSLDAVDMPVDVASGTLKEQPFIQSVFARRRALRGEAVPTTQKKLQISGPYNFQHVTHTHKDSVPDLDRRNRMDLVSEFSSMRPRRPTDASLNRFQPDESQFSNLSSESFYHQEDPSAGLGAQSRDKALPPPPPPPSPPVRSAKRSQSQDKIRFAPPRPPRSPVDNSGMAHIPPRTSSRVSVRHDRFGSLSGLAVERPATVTGFRKPLPFAPTSPQRQPPAPVSPVVESEQEEAAATQSIAHAITTPDDAAWPLSNNVTPLPDVPEEEEHHALTRPHRMSVASNHSSLRGSISVPLLRQFSMSQSHQRPPSNASETLGKFDLISAQRAIRAGAHDDQFADDADPLSWEDDIDYCYEHEAEADCDFAWERPSVDIVRPMEPKGSQAMGDQTETILTFGGLSPGLLSPGSSDMPVLSPASQLSTSTQHEAITPTNLPVTATSNFSLPRRDGSHPRNQSPESKFKEAQGFSLSPSLLIPNDYHQQMLQYERDDMQDSDDEDFLIQGNTLNDEPIMKFGKTIKPSNARSSASTTDSALSEQSMTSSRHKSTTSTSTAYTRWTGSSTSSWTARDSHPVPQKPAVDTVPSAIVQPSGKVITPPNFNEPMVLKQDLNREKHSRTQSHADLLMRSNFGGAPPAEPKPTSQTVRTRRRARTTSRSHASPQFALFPTVTPTPGGRF
ncbi:uncharacterized protein F4822DRAFT_27733 [Hypoxylon trugodes]|uniref:uncharacterized protein n=1 Tax=Hypoxylon trugodes TaxID=326681 RepID=UPI0021917D5F|nr:uncharacterized protein F4822DRAFT_27733 [Hypoxylon trugodes]KAI1393857.1 hypothetical protein F4822DRAFT_27733 [Hypoxylon trugodes]